MSVPAQSALDHRQRTVATIATAGLVLSLVAVALPVFNYVPRWHRSRSLFELFDSIGWLPVALLVAQAGLVLWAWLGRRSGGGAWAWRVLTALVSPVLPWLVLGAIGQLVIIWDGADSQGRPIGGVIEATPAIGAWLIVAGSGLMLVSVVVSLVFWLRGRAAR